MNGVTRLFVYLMVAFHVAAFVGEAALWMQIYGPLKVVPRLNPGLDVPVDTQAEVLKVLFINMGFYNLLLSLGGVLGILLVNRGRDEAGRILAAYACAFAVCAGLVLLATTAAYVGALLQAGLPAIALASMYREHSRRV